jgi:predicted naringenin-chalcone synthase
VTHPTIAATDHHGVLHRILIPSRAAHLINAMGFRPDVRRMPITDLGCAAGAMALAQSPDFVRRVSG